MKKHARILLGSLWLMQALLVSTPVSTHIWDQRSLRKQLILHLAAKAENAKGQRELQVGKELASFAESAVHEASSTSTVGTRVHWVCSYYHCPCGCGLAIWWLRYLVTSL